MLPRTKGTGWLAGFFVQLTVNQARSKNKKDLAEVSELKKLFGEAFEEEE